MPYPGISLVAELEICVQMKANENSGAAPLDIKVKESNTFALKVASTTVNTVRCKHSFYVMGPKTAAGR